MGIVLNEISPVSKDAIKLTEKLFYELEELYEEGTIEKFVEETKKMIKFIVAYENRKPVACGALKHYDSENV